MEKTVYNALVLIKLSKKIANRFAKIANGWRFLEVIRGNFKTLLNI